MKNILIAEDTAAIAEVIKLKLDNSGFTSEIAKDGVEAMEMLQLNKYDLVLLDLMMPNLDGFGVLEGMRKLHLEVPVIVTSNLGQAEDMVKARQLGAVDYYVKSDVPVSEMVKRIKSQLNIKV